MRGKPEEFLLLSHRGERCGVQQFGRRLYCLLEATKMVKVQYRECDSASEMTQALLESQPSAVIVNFHPATMPWFVRDILSKSAAPSFGIVHEGHQKLVDNLEEDGFDFNIFVDPTIVPSNPRAIVVPRFIPDPITYESTNERITIGSFGFATPGKGFERLCRAVNQQFSDATIRINIPPHDSPQIVAPENTDAIIESCRAELTKPGINLEISKNFFSDADLLRFLASNTLNAFLYDDSPERGLSSCVDYALAAGRPIAVTRVAMFRHLHQINPSICIEDTPISKIIENGVRPLFGLREQFISGNSGKQWVMAICEALDRKSRSRSVPDGRGFNKVLDDRSRVAYEGRIAELWRLAPQLMPRKIEAANIQQAFALDSVERFSALYPSPRILAVGVFEDTAVEGLKAKGYQIDAIDPAVNIDLNSFYTSEEGVQGSYDIVMCISVLEHVRDDELFVNQLADLLSPGGHAVLTIDFRDDFVPGDAKPNADFRLYTRRDITERFMRGLTDCVLVDNPTWGDGAPDFDHDGATYGFASWVFRKLQGGIRKYDGKFFASRTAPWKRYLREQLSDRDRLIRDISEEVTKQREEVCILRREYAERQQELSQRLQVGYLELGRTEQKLAQLEGDYAERERAQYQEIQEAHEALAQRERDYVAREQASIQQQDVAHQALGRMEQKLTQLERDHAAQEQAKFQQLHVAHQALGHIEQRLAQRESMHHFLDEQLRSERAAAQHLQQELRIRDVQLANLHQSLSWRLTVPFRAVRECFRRPFLDPQRERSEVVDRPAVVPVRQQMAELDTPPARELTSSCFLMEPVKMTGNQLNHMPDATLQGEVEHLNVLLRQHDRGFVERAYLTLLKRPPDPEGFRYYLERIRAGVAKVQILKQIMSSPEGRSKGVELPGLRAAVHRQRLAKLPVVSSLLRLFGVAIEGNSLFEIRLRALEQQAFLIAKQGDALIELVDRRFNGLQELGAKQATNLSTLRDRITHDAGRSSEAVIHHESERMSVIRQPAAEHNWGTLEELVAGSIRLGARACFSDGTGTDASDVTERTVGVSRGQSGGGSVCLVPSVSEQDMVQKIISAEVRRWPMGKRVNE